MVCSILFKYDPELLTDSNQQRFTQMNPPPQRANICPQLDLALLLLLIRTSSGRTPCCFRLWHLVFLPPKSHHPPLLPTSDEVSSHMLRLTAQTSSETLKTITTRPEYTPDAQSNLIIWPTVPNKYVQSFSTFPESAHRPKCVG